MSLFKSRVENHKPRTKHGWIWFFIVLALLALAAISIRVSYNPTVPPQRMTEYISAGLLPEDPKSSDYNTRALEQAIATANGREIDIPAGVYYFTAPVTLPGGATISMHGYGQGQTILRAASGATASLFLSPRGSTVQSFSIANLTIDGNYPMNTNRQISGIEISANILKIDHVEITKTIFAAVRMWQINNLATIANSYIHDVALHDGVLNHDTTMVLVDKCQAADSKLIISNNTFEMNLANPTPGGSVSAVEVVAQVPQQVYMLYNTVRNCGQDVPALDAQNVYNSTAALQIYRNGDGSHIIGNQLTNIYWTGIKVQRSSHVEIAENTINGEGNMGDTQSAVAAIVVSDRDPILPYSDIMIRNNTIRNVPDLKGICVRGYAGGGASSIQISNNTIDGSQGGISLIDAIGPIQVSGNSLSNLSGTTLNDWAIRLERVDGMLSVTDNVVSRVATLGIGVVNVVAGSLSATISGNRLSDITQEDVIVVKAVSARVFKNIVSHSHFRDFCFYDVNYVWINGNSSDLNHPYFINVKDIVNDSNSWN